MKKLVTCASLAAIGAVGLQAQYLGGAAPEKSWSISARLRGFFDDNYATLPGHLEGGDFSLTPDASGNNPPDPGYVLTYLQIPDASGNNPGSPGYVPTYRQIPDASGNNPGSPGYVPTYTKNGPTKRGSWGALVGITAAYSPNVGEMTTLGASIRYDMYYYEDRDREGDDPIDHNIQATAQFGHQFSDRYKLDASDSFVVAQEPNLLDPTPMQTSPLRSEGSNIRNTGSLVTSAKLTTKLSARGSYANTLYDYEQDKNFFDGTGDGTRSALLDKMIQSVDLQLRWDFRPNTTASLGYRFDYVDMTSKDRLWTYGQVMEYLNDARGFPLSAAATNFVQLVTATNAPTSSIRDNYSHYAYLGLDHSFNTYLTAQVKVGGQYTVFPNSRERISVADPNHPGQQMLATREHARESIGPYADASIRWSYAKDCSLQVGVIHSRNSTDVAHIGNPGDIDSLIGLLLGEYVTLDQESTTVYGAVTHAVTAKLRARLRAQWQGSTFNQKNLSDKEDNYVGVDVSADYEINKFLFAEAGYGFDVLASDLANRGFTRNRVFLGVRGTF